MRLVCLHADTITALSSLHVPFDDLTPEGLWGTPYHLVGIAAAQRDVLKGFNVELEDITPAAIQSATGAANSDTLAYGSGGRLKDGTRLRTAYRGRHIEGTVRGGKVLVDGRSYDTPSHASRGISPEKKDWDFWEYHDDSSGSWEVLGREWQLR
jgi:hypothetical protein